jgi:gas vesicle structural protein
MAIATGSRGGYIERPRPSGLADVLEVILDKGIVIDVYVRVALVGIELLTIDARIVIASVDTYLRFAEAVGRLNIGSAEDAEGLPQLVQDMTSSGAASKTRGAIEGVKEKLFGDSDEDEGEGEGDRRQRSRSRSGSSSGSGSSSRSRSSGSSSSGSRSRGRSSG